MSKPIVTIAGTYPGFEYKQANVYYYGLDLNFSTDLGKRIEVSTKNSLVYAYNLTIKDYLINVPSNRYQLALKYSIDKIFKVKSIFFQLGTSFIDKQYRTPKNVDYVAVPNAYFLMNFDMGFVVPIKNQSITFNLVVDNLLNTGVLCGSPPPPRGRGPGRCCAWWCPCSCTVACRTMPWSWRSRCWRRRWRRPPTPSAWACFRARSPICLILGRLGGRGATRHGGGDGSVRGRAGRFRGAAPHPGQARHSAAGARATFACADQELLPARPLPGPL